MLDPKVIRQDLDAVAAKLKLRGIVVDIPRIHALEEQRKRLQTQLQDIQNERNVRSKAIGQAKAKGENVEPLFQQLKELNDSLKISEEQFNRVQSELSDLLAHIPNIPHRSVPIGKSEADNQIIRTWGKFPKFAFTPKDHVDLGEKLGMDFSAAVKIASARFVVLHGTLAKLQRALVQFMLDLHVTEHGYQEIYVPYLANSDSLFGTGQLPNLKEDLFAVDGEQGFYLIPTSEVSVINTIRDEILESEQLPLKYVCHSPCFRSEAGSYGKDTRGMIRNHQFEKVELLQIVHPEKSYEAHEEITRHAETVLQRLELPYRVVSLCTADLGFSAAKTYDLEVWLPSQQCYREISSCSNTESFQSRRLQARYRDTTTHKPELLHILNGSGLAVGRTLVALLENYQDEKGGVKIPLALQKYLGQDYLMANKSV
ncbi:MAG: serine--tRNA ligase [Gammaproteobacteria bacterium]|jgi:seryl-tRNA synthetase|nr:serine--tRNA ligase [Gammaproteobacteria bacterium]